MKVEKARYNFVKQSVSRYVLLEELTSHLFSSQPEEKFVQNRPVNVVIKIQCLSLQGIKTSKRYFCCSFRDVKPSNTFY